MLHGQDMYVCAGSQEGIRKTRGETESPRPQVLKEDLCVGKEHDSCSSASHVGFPEMELILEKRM